MSGESGKRGPQFFKILLEDSPEQLRLPPAFVKHNVIDPAQGAQLKGPDGRIWHVQLNIRGKDTYLQDGWKKFVEDHSLKAYYLLLFTYDGDEQFTVQIFDKTACEIEVITTCNTSQEFNLRSGKKEGASPDSGKCPQHKLDGIDKKNSQNDISVLSRQTSLCNEAGSTQRKHMPTFKINQSEKIKIEGGELTMSKTCSYSMGNCHTSKKQPSTTEERTKAFDNANAFSKYSKCPNFLKIMKKTCVTNGFMMSIPSYFVREYLPKGKASISLIDPKGIPWEVILLCTSRGFFSGGWMAFSLGNNLREGDVCMFELVGECQMRVHIFRSEMPPPTPVKSSEKTKSLKRASHF